MLLSTMGFWCRLVCPLARTIMPTEEQILERMPVWDALSELFLDSEIGPEDHDRIATVLAQSAYTEEELLQILRHEIYPACAANLTCVAGAWGCWGEDWIREHIAPRHNQRPRLCLPAIHWTYVLGHWHPIRDIMCQQRSVWEDAGGNGRM